ncbi:MAG: ferrochelatase [Clostridia bacterium]|nr:ferrochelatase [Clostridia bacterium]
MDNNKPRGVLLMAFGGPDSLKAVEPFMTNIMGGRKPPAELVAKVAERYKLIGGKSPLPEITRDQAKAVEDRLKAAGENCRVLVGMRNWHPFIGEALQQMVAEGIEQVVGVSLSPHYSRVSTGAYAQAIDRELSRLEGKLQVKIAKDWFDHPLFIEALAERVNEALAGFPEAMRREVQVIFSAHSLPVSHIQDGDPYVVQLQTTIAALVQRLGVLDWHLGYQSKGAGQGVWLGPEVEEVLDTLASQGKYNVLLVPVGFTCDHIETLYDLDIAIREYARSKGMNFARAMALNTSPKFMEALADIARREF